MSKGRKPCLYKQGSRYVFIPYRYDGAAIQLLPAVPLDQSPLNSPAYPMAVQRLNGLASRLPTDPQSAPDIILLADRSKKLTYLNKRDWRVLEELDVTTHRHFHSDHGHLNASDSLVPIIFVRGGQEGREALAYDLRGVSGGRHPNHIRHSWAASVVSCHVAESS